MALARPVSALVEEALSQVESVSPEDVADRVNTGEITVLDVREPDEWEQGHIPGAVHVPRGWLEFKADPETPYFDERFDPEKPFVVQCAAGKRSALAAARLKEMGYRDVRNLEGGFGAWEKAGLPVER